MQRNRCLLITLSCVFWLASHFIGQAHAADARLEKRWFFVWREMNDPNEVERMIARFPKAAEEGYNGVVFAWNVAPEKAPKLRDAAKQYHLDLVPIVMGGSHDRNDAEGLQARDALFVVHGQRAEFVPDNPTEVRNGDFEDTAGHHFKGWGFQDDEGVTTFADHEVVHGGKTSLRMENISRNPNHVCRIMQEIQLQPHRQYHISVWVKTEKLVGVDPEVKVLGPGANGSISFQTFHCDATQDWKRYDLSFNSMDYPKGVVYLGSWGGTSGKLWWDDLRVEEMALVNVLRRPGCPVTVRQENGEPIEEGRDFEPIVDSQLNPWLAFHEPAALKLTANSRIKDGARLRVSFYHPILVYEDGVTSCLSEPKIFDEWRRDVKKADEMFHPAAFLMSHDELRVINQCALCQSRQMTPGELLADNVHRAAQIIREIRPDAEIWVWNDMFDPMHNAVDHYFAVNGTLAGSWKGLDKGIGIMNWHGGLKGKNCKFFADLGLRQILSGYYDGDEHGSAITEWLQNTASVPGIVGAMYTTWQDKYDAIGPLGRQSLGRPSRLVPLTVFREFSHAYLELTAPVGWAGMVADLELTQRSMIHRHLNHQELSLAAIDDVIARGKRKDWEDLRLAILECPTLLEKIERVCGAHIADPRAQRYHFWMNYAGENLAA